MSDESSTVSYPRAAAERVVAVGGHLGRYRIDDVIGAGGRGIVLAAHDPELARAIALKVLRRDDAVSQTELLIEGQAMARLRHPNVVSVYDVGVVADRVFIAMELVAGLTLRAWQARARPWRSVVEIYLAAARGLAAAHAAGVVHADFKPDNVLVGDDGTVRVADFGVASVVRTSDPGRILGTPAYMAPEQHDGGAIGPAADQFAFATALWEALAGARPFDGTGVNELRIAKQRGPLAPPRRAAPGWIFALLRRALAVAPVHRHASMAALVAALETGLARRKHWIGGGIFVAAIAATAVSAAAVASRNPRPDCGLARAAIEHMWHPGTRDAIAASFARMHRPHARDTAARVTAEIDRRFTTLALAREGVCAATYERGEQSPDALDRRVACLDRQAGQLSALLDVFMTQADDAVADHAYEAITSLPDPESCAGANQPLPAPQIRAQVAALERRRAGAEALLAAGRPLQARALLEALTSEARAVGFPPLVATVEHDLARAITHANDVAAAASAFQSAAQAAALAGDDALIAEAWLGLLDALSEAGKSSEAYDRLGFAEVAVVRAGGARLREELLFTRGGIEFELNMLSQAKTDLEVARASLSARGQARSLADARIEDLLAIVVSAMGDNETSLALHRDALATFTSLLGDEHLIIAIELNNLARRLEVAGEIDEAERMLRRSLAIKERSFEPDNVSIAMTLHNLGVVVAARGDPADAASLTERALGIRERALGPSHPLVATSLATLGNLYRIIARPAEALAAAQRSLEIREHHHGSDDQSLVGPLHGIAHALIDLGRAAEAERPAVRARSILERSLGVGAGRTGVAWGVLGDVATALHRSAAACSAYDRAVAILEDNRGTEKDLIDPLSGQAECAMSAGDVTRARTAADRALAIVANTRQPAYRGGRARLVRAQVLWAAPATRAAARDEALQAIAVYDHAPPGTSRARARAQHWLAAHRF